MRIHYTTQFREDYKLALEQGREMALLDDILYKLENKENIEDEYMVYHLSSPSWLKGYCILYIQPDWVLLYKMDKKIDELSFTRTGDPSIT